MALIRKNFLITGVPGVGKTTLIRNLAEELKPFCPVGFYTAEMREGGHRVGFELISLDGRRGLLAQVESKGSFRVGKYGVNVKGFENFLDTIPFFDPVKRLIIIDEIGKMECLSQKFRGLLKELLDSEKGVVATIAMKGAGLIEEVKGRKDVKIFGISERNRDRLLSEILKEINETSLLPTPNFSFPVVSG
jgi:nucleoside-triphosphatase